ncbi:hypothetical protein, partial [Mesorhizobium sp.]|uniref:hypothetical protein n=1 Tax=Mesorhizobium sp. TaxID=1871066 RepID=UPI0025D37DE9
MGVRDGSHIGDEPVAEKAHERGYKIETRIERQRAAGGMLKAEAMLQGVQECEVRAIELNEPDAVSRSPQRHAFGASCPAA